MLLAILQRWLGAIVILVIAGTLAGMLALGVRKVRIAAERTQDT
jgi:hypothetical protein